MYSIYMINAWKSLSICCHGNQWFISNWDWIIEEEKEQRDQERPEKTLPHNNKSCGNTVCESPLCGLISNFCIILVGIINTEPCLRRFIDPGCISIESIPINTITGSHLEWGPSRGHCSIKGASKGGTRIESNLGLL